MKDERNLGSNPQTAILSTSIVQFETGLHPRLAPRNAKKLLTKAVCLRFLPSQLLLLFPLVRKPLFW